MLAPVNASSSPIRLLQLTRGATEPFETPTWITAYDMIAFRIQDVVTIRYMDKPCWPRQRYVYILKSYRSIPEITVQKSMMKPEERSAQYVSSNEIANEIIRSKRKHINRAREVSEWMNVLFVNGYRREVSTDSRKNQFADTVSAAPIHFDPDQVCLPPQPVDAANTTFPTPHN